MAEYGGGSLDVVMDSMGGCRNYYYCSRKCLSSVHPSYALVAVADVASGDSNRADGTITGLSAMADEHSIGPDIDQRLPLVTTLAELTPTEHVHIFSASLFDDSDTTIMRPPSPSTSRVMLQPDIVSSRATVPLPFVRSLRYHMDGCGAKNESQFCFGGLALLCMRGIIDSVSIILMVAGHTKFAPDLVAQHVAGGYNRRDTFNHAHLRINVEPHSSSIGYDGALLDTWKAGTVDLFGAIDHVMAYRLFLIFRDDGEVDLGAQVDLPSNMEPFPDAGPLFGEAEVDKAMRLPARRSLISSILRNVIDGRHQGIGSHLVSESSEGLTEAGEEAVGAGGASGKYPKRLIPYSVDAYTPACILSRRSESEPVWREQVLYMNPHSLEVMNAALKKIVPVHTVPGSEKLPYGQKVKSIREQNWTWVPIFCP